MPQVSRELLAKLPRTFVPALNEQMRNWDLLFPAEQRSISAQLDWLRRLPDSRFRELFEPIEQIEARMELPGWDLSTDRVSITDTGILVRSPYYPQWRAAVVKVFDQINAGIESEHKTVTANRLVLCVFPAGLTLPSAPVWPHLEKLGRWVPLETRFAAILEPLVDAVAARPPGAGSEALEQTWTLEYDSRVTNMEANTPACVLSFGALGPLRREFLARLNAIQKDLRSVDATYEDLRRMDLHKLMPAGTANEARVREFIRNLFLSGNGSMLFGNSFVQWGASEIIRRAQPKVLFCCFGIRPKLKPFSSVVLFEDQNRANPVADQPDPEGSLIDVRLLTEYVYLSASQHPAYAGRTVYLFAVPELDRILVVAPPEFALPAKRMTATELSSAATRWLA